MYSQPPYASHSSRSSTSSVNTYTTYDSGSGSPQNMTPMRMPGDVPGAVRSLLLSTKQLQEALRLWSIGQASETQVSDIYVQIGTQFNATIHAFAYHKIDLSDIHSIPKELRAVLEQCLAEDPSPESLAMFMPEVRQVLYKLLKGLQLRQDAWRSIGGQMPMIPHDAR